MRILFFVVAYYLMVIYILNIEKGDYVTRNSYDNDTVFKVINIKNGVYYLKGVHQVVIWLQMYANNVVPNMPVSFIQHTCLIHKSISLFVFLYVLT